MRRKPFAMLGAILCSLIMAFATTLPTMAEPNDSGSGKHSICDSTEKDLPNNDPFWRIISHDSYQYLCAKAAGAPEESVPPEPKHLFQELMKATDVVKAKTSPEWVESMKNPCDPAKGNYVCDGTEDEPEIDDPFWNTIDVDTYRYIREKSRGIAEENLPPRSNSFYPQVVEFLEVAQKSVHGLPGTGV